MFDTVIFQAIQIVLVLIAITLSLVMFASMALHQHLNVEQKIVWFLVMILLPGVGSLMYYFIRYDGKYAISWRRA